MCSFCIHLNWYRKTCPHNNFVVTWLTLNIHHYLIKVLFLFYCTELFIFYGSIFCSSVALVWTFNTRGVYNFITKTENFPVNLVPFFNGVSFLFCRFLKSGVTDELKSLFLLKGKKVTITNSKQDKTLLLFKR